MAKREVKSVSDGVVRDDVISKSQSFYQGKPDESPEEEKETKPGMIVSRLDHPVSLSYSGEGMMLPPRGKEKIANINKLGKLPAGVSLILLK